MEIKNERLSLRISEDEKKLIRKIAIDKDMKISEYIMYLVNKDINKQLNNNNLSFKFKVVESSVKCINSMLEEFKNHETSCKIGIPLVLPSVKQLIQELEDLKKEL